MLDSTRQLADTPISPAELACKHEPPYITVDCAVCRYLRSVPELREDHAALMERPEYRASWSRLLRTRRSVHYWNRALAFMLPFTKFIFWFYVVRMLFAVAFIMDGTYRPAVTDVLLDGGLIVVYYFLLRKFEKKWPS